MLSEPVDIQRMIDAAVAKAVAPLHARIRVLEKQNQRLKAENHRLQEENQRLQKENDRMQKANHRLEAKIARLERHSKNSSKPPSSDFFKTPPTPDDPAKTSPPKRKIGGQPGHPKATRPVFDEDQIDDIVEYMLTDDEIETRKLTFIRFDTIQHVELPEKLFNVTEYRRAVYRDAMGRLVYAAMDEGRFPVSCFGPRLKAWVAWMHTTMHASISKIRQMLTSVCGIVMCDGMISKCIGQCGQALATAYHQLIEVLPDQRRLFIDETGNKCKGKRGWNWIFAADDFSVIRTESTRSTDVLDRTLGDDFAGLMHCDYYNVYRCYLKNHSRVPVQHCLAHLVRELRFVAESNDENTQVWAQVMLGGLRHLIHSDLDPYSIMRLKQVMTESAERYQGQPRGQALAKRLAIHLDDYLRFLDDPLAETTNNRAERGIRSLVLHRKVTQGTRSERGNQTLERLQTLCATAKQQARSGYQFLVDSLNAKIHQTPAPSLLRV